MPETEDAWTGEGVSGNGAVGTDILKAQRATEQTDESAGQGRYDSQQNILLASEVHLGAL